MTYAHVIDGQIVAVGLPSSWRWTDGSTTSGFDTLPDEDLARAGWLPVTEDRPPLGDGEQYGEPSYTVDGDTVTATYPTVTAAPPAPTVDPTAVLAAVGASLAAIPANATSTQMRSTLRTLGEQITAAIPT